MRKIAVLSLVCLAARTRAPAQPLAFDPPITHATGAVPEPIALGDIDADGVLDVAIACTGGAGGDGRGTVTVLLGIENGTFRTLGPFPAGNRPEGLVLGRFNQDGFLDAATANFESDTVTILFGTGRGALSAPRPTSVPGGPRSVAAADLNGDGFEDLAVASYWADTVSILEGDRRGRFTLKRTFATGDGPEVVAIARLDGDAAPDLVTSDALGDTISPFLNQAGGEFLPGPRHPTGFQPRYVLAADFDGDGLDDLAFANNDSHGIGVARNRGGLAFVQETTLEPKADGFFFHEPVYLAFADLDGDGHGDLAASWAATGLATVHFGAPFSNDRPFWSVPAGDTPVGIAAADLNGDQAADLVIASALDDAALIYSTYLANPGFIADNDGPGTQRLGPWAASDAPFAFDGDSVFSKDGARYAWEVPVPAPGAYEVLLWWTVTSNRSAAAPLEVEHADGSSSLLLDQRSGAGVWHSLGVFTFEGAARVVLTAPQGEASVSADAVRLRPVPGRPNPDPPRIPVALHERPDEALHDGVSRLAFHGTLTVGKDRSPFAWNGAVFTPIGNGEESASIQEARLYADTNRNGAHDDGDERLGDPRAFGSDIRAITFDGFQVELPAGNTDFFVVCDLVPKAAARRVASAAGGRAGPALAGAALLALGLALLVCRRAGRTLLVPGAVALAVTCLSFVLVAGAGCGGDGGGGGSGGPETLQIELTALVIHSQKTGEPAAIEGLPLAGWEF
jgi:hypothetical protein